MIWQLSKKHKLNLNFLLYYTILYFENLFPTPFWGHCSSLQNMCYDSFFSLNLPFSKYAWCVSAYVALPHRLNMKRETLLTKTICYFQTHSVSHHFVIFLPLQTQNARYDLIGCPINSIYCVIYFFSKIITMFLYIVYKFNKSFLNDKNAFFSVKTVFLFLPQIQREE